MANPSNPQVTPTTWTDYSLAGTGFETPPTEVKSYTPVQDIIQRIYDPNTLSIKIRLQSGKFTKAVAASTSVSSKAGTLGTLSNTTVNAGAPAATGLIEVYDGIDTSGTLLWAGTLAAGAVVPLNLPVVTGIYVSIASGSIAVSFA